MDWEIREDSITSRKVGYMLSTGRRLRFGIVGLYISIGRGGRTEKRALIKVYQAGSLGQELRHFFGQCVYKLKVCGRRLYQ